MTDHLGRNVAAGIAGLIVAVLLLASAAMGGLNGASGSTSPVSAGSSGATVSVASIPPAILTLYIEAAGTCPGLSWSLLAAIGTVESDNGQSSAPGVSAGTNAFGAAGIMQFELATFAEYDEPVPPGGADPPSPYDAVDAIYAAERLLCANGAANDVDVPDAVWAYNHSALYVEDVLALAATYAGETPPTGSIGSTDEP